MRVRAHPSAERTESTRARPVRPQRPSFGPEAQRVVAREYGFASWSQLRAHVQAARGVDAAVDAFLQAVSAGDAARAAEVLDAEPRVAGESLHVAAALGLEREVRARVAADGSLVSVRAGSPPERESSLHVAARRGLRPELVRLLLDRGADVHARRGDGRTAWLLARRGGFDEVAGLLEAAGAATEALEPADLLLAACGRGDAGAAPRLASPALLAALEPADLRLLPEGASRGRPDVVAACLAAGFPVGAPDEHGATALHHASIRGDAGLVSTLLRLVPDLEHRDTEHGGTPLDWACFGADFVSTPGGDDEGAVRALLAAGSRLGPNDHRPGHAGVLEVLRAAAQADI